MGDTCISKLIGTLLLPLFAGISRVKFDWHLTVPSFGERLSHRSRKHRWIGYCADMNVNWAERTCTQYIFINHLLQIHLKNNPEIGVPPVIILFSGISSTNQPFWVSCWTPQFLVLQIPLSDFRTAQSPGFPPAWCFKTTVYPLIIKRGNRKSTDFI